jgi:phage recombination protein Bet
MSNALTTTKQSDQELIAVLQSSLYPGAAIGSVQMVLNYCAAAGLDPMQKPVHIVPIWDAKAGEMRDVVMPGIGLYRTQAARSGNYAGVSDAEYGPDVTEKLGGVEITYPAWCKVSVKRLLPNGQVAEFSATERWKENYAVKGGKEKSIAPNAMWTKRPYGQVAKCAEAQALRKAFPEFGSAATADEMEGKEINMGSAEVVTQSAERKPEELPAYPEADFAKNLDLWRSAIAAGKAKPEQLVSRSSTKYTLTDEQIAAIYDLAKPAHVDNDGVIVDAEFTKAYEQGEAA